MWRSWRVYVKTQAFMPGSFLVIIKCRTYGKGHGQGNFYVQSDGKARGL